MPQPDIPQHVLKPLMCPCYDRERYPSEHIILVDGKDELWVKRLQGIGGHRAAYLYNSVIYKVGNQKDNELYVWKKASDSDKIYLATLFDSGVFECRSQHSWVAMEWVQALKHDDKQYVDRRDNSYQEMCRIFQEGEIWNLIKGDLPQVGSGNWGIRAVNLKPVVWDYVAHAYGV